MDFGRLFFSSAGRIGRQEFWTGFLALALILALSIVVASEAIGDAFGNQLAGFIVELVLVYPAYCVLAKRLHDRSRSSLYAVGAIIVLLLPPLLSLLGANGTEDAPSVLSEFLFYLELVVLLAITIDLGIMPGTPGPNAFGPDPLAAA